MVDMSAEGKINIADIVPPLDRVVGLYLADRLASNSGNQTAVDRLLVASAYPFAGGKAERVFSGFTDQGVLFLAARAQDTAEIFVATADMRNDTFTEWEPHGQADAGAELDWPVPLVLMSSTGQRVLGLDSSRGGWELIDGGSAESWSLKSLSVLVAAAAGIRG